MALRTVRRLGNQLIAYFSDNSTLTLYSTGNDIWIASGREGGGGDPAGSTPTGADPVASTGAVIYNPWSNYSISGTWASHMSYSQGGIDYPLPYGTNLKAPAAGTLHTSGGSGEFASGWVGSAGRRSVLYLDTPISRVNATMEQKEGSGPLYAIVFQHQSEFGTDRAHYALGAIVGKSGASADGDDRGGDVHLHVHGLNQAGTRVDLLNFIS